MTPPPPPTEDELIDAARQGDRRATDRLLRDQQPRIYAVCRRIAGNDADALDATQEAMIAIVRGLPRFDGRARFSTWVYRVATNACLDELRRRRRRPIVGLPQTDEGVTVEPVDTGPAISDTVSDRLLLDNALADLPEDFRAAVVLRDVCQLDYAEISDVLGIPPGTVRSRIARGRAHLAKKIAESGNQVDAGNRQSPQP